MNDWLKITEPNKKACELLRNAVGMQSFGRLIDIAYWVMQTAHIEGDIVEMGIHEGRTAALITSLTKKDVWLYDSFEGLPEPTREDCLPPNHPHFHHGAMKVSAAFVLNQHGDAGLKSPNLVPRFFRDLKPEDMPKAIAFAHLDGDLYESIKTSLELVWPRLSIGGICIVDDTRHDELKGALAAFNEHFAGRHDWIVEASFEPNGERAIHSVIRKIEA